MCLKDNSDFVLFKDISMSRYHRGLCPTVGKNLQFSIILKSTLTVCTAKIEIMSFAKQL